MDRVDLHPSELGYAFSYSKTAEVIGWGGAPFLPAEGDDPARWYADGEARLLAAGRLVGTVEDGLNFTDAMARAVLALANPAVVLLAQRKAGEGMRTLTVHAAGSDLVALTRRSDGMFELTPHADLTAAAGACAGFVGAALAPPETETRIEADQRVVSRLVRLAGEGETRKVLAALVRLGATEAEAASALAALARPAAAGIVAVLYCAGNRVRDAETYSVLTTAEDRTWVVFPPAGLDGPMVLERSSAAALSARIAVAVAARLGGPG